MASDDHRFLSSSLYSSGALVAWDPAPFSANLTQVTFTSYCTHRKHAFLSITNGTDRRPRHSRKFMLMLLLRNVSRTGNRKNTEMVSPHANLAVTPDDERETRYSVKLL